MNRNQWYLVGNTFMGNYGGNNAYVRAYTRFTEQDIANNRTYVEYQCRFYVEQYYITSGKPTGGSAWGTSANQVYSNDLGGTYYAGETTIASSSAWVYHENDGSKTISAFANMYTTYLGANKTTSGSIQLPTIPRSSILSAINEFDIENGFTVSFEKKLPSFLQRLTIKMEKITKQKDGVILKQIDNVENGQKINFTQSEKDTFYTNYSDTNYGNLTVFLDTYRTDFTAPNLIGTSSVSSKALITNSSPLFSDFSFSNVNTVTLPILSNDGSYFIGKTGGLKVSIPISSKATPQKGASISHYLVVWGTKSKMEVYSSNTVVEIYGEPLLNEDTPIINVYAVDSRGNTKLVTKNVTNWIAYDFTKVYDNSYNRVTSVSEDVNFKLKGLWTNTIFNKNKNTLSTSYRFKETGTTNWSIGSTPINVTIVNNEFTFDGLLKGDTNAGFSKNKSFDVEIIVKDLLGQNGLNEYATFKFLVKATEDAIQILKSKIALGCEINKNGSRVQLSNDTSIDGNRILNSKNIINDTNSSSTNDVLSANQGKILNEKINKKQETLLVKEFLLTTRQKIITIDGLDLNAHGGVYDFIISSLCSGGNDWICSRINGINEKMYVDKRLFNPSTNAYQSIQNTYGALNYMPIGVASEFQHINSVTTGIISIDNYKTTQNKTIVITSKTFCPTSTTSYDVYSCAYATYQQFNNLTSLTLFCENNDFLEGTKIKIYRR